MSETAIEHRPATIAVVHIPEPQPELTLHDRQRRAVEQAAIETARLAASKRLRHRLIVASLMVPVLAISALAGRRYWLWSQVHESTDDAFVDGHIVQVGPKVAGTILRVCVNDNQPVRKGDLLAELDPKDFELKVAQAQAALDVAVAKQRGAELNVEMTQVTSAAAVTQARAGVEVCRAAVESAKGMLASAQADVSAAEAEYGRAAANLDRYAQLDSRSISARELDGATASARMADAQVRAARKKVIAAEAQVAEAQARVMQAQGALDAVNIAPQQIAVSKSQAQNAAAEVEQARARLQQATLDMDYTRVFAPDDGRVTRKTAEAGAYVGIGQPLLSLVPAEMWVVANFKETQIRQMQPGQRVEIRIDAYGDRPFHGHIDSIQTGTSSAFSLLPPDNATGNYVKVVQRVPVKIVVDDGVDASHPLSPGMSVVPTVETGPGRGGREFAADKTGKEN